MVHSLQSHNSSRPLANLLFAMAPTLAFCTWATAEPLRCDVGPITRILGGTQWQVTSCNDGYSLVFATVNGNPAMPFVFIVQRAEGTAKISGEGNGSKEHSAAAYEELASLTATQFDELVQATILAENKK